MPRLLPIAALWSLVGHPSFAREWTLARKIRAIADAGFAGLTDHLTPEHRRLAEQAGLAHLVGMIETDDPADFTRLLRAQKEAGAVQVNVHLGRHDTPPAVATRQWIRLVREAEKLGGLVVSLEVHRNRCTETPEKTFAIADRYQKETGEPIRLNFDFSHLAVVKHLMPDEYAARLLARPELVQHACLFHFRPFNGQHCQVPVTHRGRLTPEVLAYLDFVRAVMRLWRDAPANRTRTLFACPELGPRRLHGGGYNLTGLPPAWTDAVALMREMQRVWADTTRR